MSQYNFGNIDTGQTDGVELAQLLESFRDALHSMHSGATAPSYGVKGMLWLDTSATPHPIKLSDGSDWIQIGDLNPATNIFRPNLAGVGLGALAYKSLIVAGDITDGIITPAKLAPSFVLGVDKGGTGANTAAAARTALGLVIGTNVQAFHANLAAEAGLVGAANKLPYYTDVGLKSLADFSPFARTLLDDIDAATARATLGVGTSAGSLLSVSYFKTSGTWTKSTNNPSSIIVEVIGGGGGGGRHSASAGCGGGGGAGGYARKRILAATLGDTETVTVGAGGTGGGNGPAGGTGGTSSFGAHCSATGGTGAPYSSSTATSQPGGLGGVGSNGDINLNGSSGGPVFNNTGWSQNTKIHSNGAPGFLGQGGGRGGIGESEEPTAGGANTGAGGGGKWNGGASAAGAGGSGLVIVWEYS